MVDSWMNYMRHGAFEEAWKISDAILRSNAGKPCWHLPRHRQYIWDGTSLEGKRVLVRCYHGLGDTIQFIRYAPLLKAIAREVIVWAQPQLIPLLESVRGIDRLLPLHDGTPGVAFDTDVEVMELPHIFRTTLASIPSENPYLHVEPAPLPSGDGQLSAGLVWRAGVWDADRSVPFSALTALAGEEGVRFYILQAGAEAAGWDGSLGVHPGEFILSDYARVIRSLDLLITVDSMSAHLAGALGVPVWTLIRYEPDWRWMHNRNDSPWYPTMRLFRQERAGDWEGAIRKAADRLKSITRSGNALVARPVRETGTA